MALPLRTIDWFSSS